MEENLYCGKSEDRLVLWR